MVILFETIRVSKCHVGDWGTSAAIVNDILHNSSNIPISFGIVQIPKLWLRHSQMTISFENTLLVTSSLTSNNSTHSNIDL